MKLRAPGRICLFGEHQDYLGYPIIAAAVDRFIFLESRQISNPIFDIKMPDVQHSLKLQLKTPKELPYRIKRDYLTSSYNIVRRLGYKWDENKGYEIIITGNIPINAGASSSSAMIIVWLLFLIKISGQTISFEELANLGYKAEVKEFGEAGGMMDHFTSAIGGLLYMDTAPKFQPYKIKNFQTNFSNSFILIDSKQKKNTTSDLLRIKMLALESLHAIKELFPKFDPYNTEISEIEPYLSSMEEKYRDILMGNLKNRDITRKARELLLLSEKKELNDNEKIYLGSLLNQHQENLSKKIRISTDKINRIINLCLENGACGAKINGSGFGGTVIAYAPKSRGKLLGILKENDIESFPIEISQGAGEYKK